MKTLEERKTEKQKFMRNMYLEEIQKINKMKKYRKIQKFMRN